MAAQAELETAQRRQHEAEQAKDEANTKVVRLTNQLASLLTLQVVQPEEVALSKEAVDKANQGNATVQKLKMSTHNRELYSKKFQTAAGHSLQKFSRLKMILKLFDKSQQLFLLHASNAYFKNLN